MAATQPRRGLSPPPGTLPALQGPPSRSRYQAVTTSAPGAAGSYTVISPGGTGPLPSSPSSAPAPSTSVKVSPTSSSSVTAGAGSSSPSLTAPGPSTSPPIVPPPGGTPSSGGPPTSPGPITPPSPTLTIISSPPNPVPGPGLLGRILFRLGFVPQSQFKALSTQAVSLQQAISAAQSSISSLSAQDATVQATIASLGQQITAAKAALNSLLSSNSSGNSQVASLQSQISSAQALVNGDNSTIATLRSLLAGAVASLNGLTSISASPAFASPGNGLVTQDSYDQQSGYTGFVDPGTTSLNFTFGAGLSGLTSGTSMDAAPATGGIQLGVGGRFATALGYLPIRQLTDATSQVSGLQSQLTALASQEASLKAKLAADQATSASLSQQLAGIQGQVGQAQAAATSLSGQLSNLQSQLSALTSAHQANLSMIASLRSQIGSVNGVLSAAQSGQLPVSFSWDFGDGGNSTDQNPSHTYVNAGTFRPSVTVTVNVPATPVTQARTIVKTFSLPGILIGLWPTQVQVSGGGASTSGTLHWRVLTTNGTGVPNTRLEERAKDALGVTTGDFIDITDTGGNAYANYTGAGTAIGRSLRNPRASAQTGLATL